SLSRMKVGTDSRLAGAAPMPASGLAGAAAAGAAGPKAPALPNESCAPAELIRGDGTEIAICQTATSESAANTANNACSLRVVPTCRSSVLPFMCLLRFEVAHEGAVQPSSGLSVFFVVCCRFPG